MPPEVLRANRYAKRLDQIDEDLPKDVNKFLFENHLEPGDVVSFSDYRDEESYIVYRRPDHKLDWFKNPDYTEAGYLSIPVEVSRQIGDVLSFYKEVLGDRYITIHCDASDILIRRGLDRNIPKEWIFSIECMEGMDDPDVHLNVNPKQKTEWQDIGTVSSLDMDKVKPYLPKGWKPMGKQT